MTMIYVFKTSVKTKKSARQASAFLDGFLPQARWNFDLEDADRILRIESKSNITEGVIKGLNGLGFDCQELR
jgi:hypothetical protein